MKSLLTYTELEDYLYNHFNKIVELKYVSEKCISSKVDVKLLLLLKSVSIDITVDEIKDAEIHLSYSGGVAIDTIIKGIGVFNKSKMKNDAFTIDTSTQKVVIHLWRIEQMRKIIETCEFKDVKFSPEYAQIEVVLK
jgi:hypothetical protein